MAAGFTFDGTDDYVTLADNAAYDVAVDGDSLVWQVWFNPDNARTAPEVIIERSAWFTVYLTADDRVMIEFADGTNRTLTNKVTNGTKNHLVWALKLDAAVASGTADANVPSYLIDANAEWWTNGVNKTNSISGRYLVYNRTDRTYDYGTVIDDVVFTASADTVNTTSETVTTPVHGLADGVGVTVTGADVPAGLTSGNTYYVNAATATTLLFYNTAANAITGGATGKVNLTDVGSGTVTISAKEISIKLDSDLCPDGNEVVAIFAEPWQAELRVWLNGVRQSDINETLYHFNPPADSAEAIQVGRLKAGSNFFDGLMNNLAVWTPGWPTDEIVAALYNGGTELTYATTITADGGMTNLAYWAFDDDAASTTVDNDEGTGGLDGTASQNTSVVAATTIDPTSYWVADRVLKFSAATTLTGRYVIDKIVWTGTSVTAGDDLVLEDGEGSEIVALHATGTTVNETWSPDAGFLVNGLEVATIDSGEVYVYLA